MQQNSCAGAYRGWGGGGEGAASQLQVTLVSLCDCQKFNMHTFYEMNYLISKYFSYQCFHFFRL